MNYGTKQKNEKENTNRTYVNDNINITELRI